MNRAMRVTIHALLMGAREHPSQGNTLLRQALRLAQQALANDATDNEAIRHLGLLWWHLGARRRGQVLLRKSRHR